MEQLYGNLIERERKEIGPLTSNLKWNTNNKIPKQKGQQMQRLKQQQATQMKKNQREPQRNVEMQPSQLAEK